MNYRFFVLTPCEDHRIKKQIFIYKLILLCLEREVNLLQLKIDNPKANFH